MKNRIITCSLLLLLSSYSYSQDDFKRIIGLTATIQSDEFGIQVPIWVTHCFTIAPSIEIEYAQTQGANEILGIVPKYYFNMKNKLVPYIGLKVGAAIFSPPSSLNETGTVDKIAGVAFGGEYFFDPRFSIGVEAQLNYTKSDPNSTRFGSPGNSNINTATVITANVYFGK